MDLQYEFCEACRQLTSGDCGRHGPHIISIGPGRSTPVEGEYDRASQLAHERDAAILMLGRLTRERDAARLALELIVEEIESMAVVERSARDRLVALIARRALGDSE